MRADHHDVKTVAGNDRRGICVDKRFPRGIQFAMKIGILLTTGTDHENGYLVGKLSEAWLRQGHEVDLFLMGEGVYHAQAISSPKRPYAAMPALLALGAKVAVCGVTAEARGVSETDLYPGIEIASQYELSRIVDRADRFLTFGD